MAATTRAALLAALSMCVAVMAQAQAPAGVDPAALVAQQTELRARVVAGRGMFREQSPAERDALAADQARLIALLRGQASFDALAPAQREEAVGLMATIRDAVARAEDERRVCEQVRRIGSNRPQVVCMTAAQARKRRGGQAGMPAGRADTCGGGNCINELSGQLIQVGQDKLQPAPGLQRAIAGAT